MSLTLILLKSICWLVVPSVLMRNIQFVAAMGRHVWRRSSVPAQRCKPAGYDADLSDAERESIEPLIYPPGARRGRGRLRDPDSARACAEQGAALHTRSESTDVQFHSSRRGSWEVRRPYLEAPALCRVLIRHKS